MMVSSNVVQSAQCRLIVVLCVTLLAASCTNVLGARVQLSPEAVQAWLEDSGLLQDQTVQVGRRSSEPGSLWFGPRLGRRRRSPPEDEEALLSVEPIAAETIMELLRDSPWTVIALKEYPSGKRQTLTFTPRLGRDMDEATSELLSTVGLRTPPFSPRLGRGNGLPFSPRLGRQQHEHEQQTTTSARVGRDVHEQQH